MAEPFLGEIRLFAFNNVPQGWAKCEGQILNIATNSALFSILGNRYGGNGTTTFALPDLRGRTPIDMGNNGEGLHTIAESGGEAEHTLTINEMPAHTHIAYASSTIANATQPTNNFWGSTSSSAIYSSTSNVQMQASALSLAGGSQPHANMQPSLALSFCIATAGIYPSRS